MNHLHEYNKYRKGSTNDVTNVFKIGPSRPSGIEQSPAEDVIEPIMHKGEALKAFHSNLSVLTEAWCGDSGFEERSFLIVSAWNKCLQAARFVFLVRDHV